MRLSDYVILYAVLIVMGYLISGKFSRNLFNKRLWDRTGGGLVMVRLEHVNKYFNRRKKNEIHVINDTSAEWKTADSLLFSVRQDAVKQLCSMS